MPTKKSQRERTPDQKIPWWRMGFTNGTSNPGDQQTKTPVTFPMTPRIYNDLSRSLEHARKMLDNDQEYKNTFKTLEYKLKNAVLKHGKSKVYPNPDYPEGTPWKEINNA